MGTLILSWLIIYVSLCCKSLLGWNNRVFKIYLFLWVLQFMEYHLPPMRNSPELLKALLAVQSSKNAIFFKTLETIIVFFMNSIRAKWEDHATGLWKFHPTITVHIRLFHLIGPARNLPKLSSKFISVYFYDSDYTKQVILRLRYDSNLNLSIFQDLTKILHVVYPGIRAGRTYTTSVYCGYD